MQIPQSFQTANIFSGPDLLVVIAIAVLLFGGKKIPEVARGLGEGIKSFKQAIREDEPPKTTGGNDKEASQRGVNQTGTAG